MQLRDEIAEQIVALAGSIDMQKAQEMRELVRQARMQTWLGSLDASPQEIVARIEALESSMSKVREQTSELRLDVAVLTEGSLEDVDVLRLRSHEKRITSLEAKAGEGREVDARSSNAPNQVRPQPEEASPIAQATPGEGSDSSRHAAPSPAPSPASEILTTHATGKVGLNNCVEVAQGGALVARFYGDDAQREADRYIASRTPCVDVRALLKDYYRCSDGDVRLSVKVNLHDMTAALKSQGVETKEQTK